jgi:RNA polymerase sigma-70 factor (ECF subfamily)
MTKLESGVKPELPEWSTLSDEELVRRILEGETSLFEILMRRYNQRLFRVARSVLKDDDEAEDVMQQAYVNAYQHLGQFAGRARFATWLTKIALHEALARARRRDRYKETRDMSDKEEPASERLAATELNPEQQAMTGELREALERSLDGIPELYRSVFVLREVEGLDTTEAAECLGVSEDVVKTRFHRARRLLRSELLERAGVASAEVFRFHLKRCDRVVAGVLSQLGLSPPRTPECDCAGEFCQKR